MVSRLLSKNEKDRPSIHDIFQSEMVKRVMNDFVKASGHLQIRIPVKSTNIHHEVIKQQKEEAEP